jgi:Uma2 family endonuclease
VLDKIRWTTYESLLPDLGEHIRFRLTFDQGRLQILSPLPEHESFGIQLGQFVRVLATTCRIAYKCLGSITLRREDLERGLESDNCFYLVNWSRIRGRRQLDFTRDPPPDLALEIDITHSSLDRLSIYAALAVPEVWRFDSETLLCYHLNNRGTYDEHPQSRAFPFLRVADVVPFLLQVFDLDEDALTQNFRAWVQGLLAPAAGDASTPDPEQP